MNYIPDLYDMMRSMERVVAKSNSFQAPKPMPKPYQKSKQFRNIKTLKKK